MRKLWIVVMTLALGFSGAAWASVALALSVEDLTARADVVVRGHVTAQEARWTRGGRIVTTVHLAVDQALKGAPPSAIEIRHPGGRVGDIAQQVSGEVAFTDGEEAVVFLRQHLAGPGTYVVVGMSQGKFHVDRGQPTPLAVQKLDGLGLKRPDTGAIEDRPGESLPLEQLEQRILRAAHP